MAKDICLDTRVMEQIADRLAALASNMDSIGGRLGNIRLPEEAGGNLRLPVSVKLKSTGGSYGGSGNLNATLRSLASGLKALGSCTEKASDHVQDAADDLADLERTMARMFNGDSLPDIWNQRPLNAAGSSSMSDGDSGGLAIEYEKIGLFVSKTAATLKFGDYSFDFNRRLTPLSAKTTYKATNDGKFSKTESFVGLRSEVLKGKVTQKRPALGKSEEGDKTKDDKGTDYKRGLSLLRLGADFSKSVGYDLVSEKMSNDRASLTADVHARTKEGHIKANAGLYTYKVTADGKSKRVFAPGADVDIGASYTLLDATVSGEYELIDNVSVTSKIAATGGQVSGKAKGELGYVDGKWVAAGELSAEAILARAEGEIGLDVAGVKGTVGGAVDFGFGAHAKGGYKDGKLYCDVGASFGVGANLSVELDVGGLVENVSKGAEYLYNGAKNIMKGASKMAEGLFSWIS